MTDHECFCKLADEADEVVGGFSGLDFKETLSLLGEFDADDQVRYEFFRKGDTIARAYWNDTGSKGEPTGGCISVYAPLYTSLGKV